MKRRQILLLCIITILIPLLVPPVEGSARASGNQTVKLSVDATEAPRKLFHAREVIPVNSGPLTLYYPKWIPGEHGPTGPISNLSGLNFTASGKTLPWQRDPVDMYAFHLDVPQGADVIDVSLEFLAPTFAGGFSSGSSTTPHLAVLSWNWLLLYPSIAHTDDLRVEASLRLPPGWKFGTGLTTQHQSGGQVDFQATSLTTLVDSPVLAGEHLRAMVLSTDKPTVEIDIAADSPTALHPSPQFTDAMRKLVRETKALFGAEHYEHYHFLFTLSDRVAHFGLEHHQSNDSRVAERSLIDETQGRLAFGVLSHEYVHSWNGKYRRPAGLATPDYQTPMHDEMLWVYEGLTQYYGNVLAVRSGLWTPQQYVDTLAQTAARLDHTPGRLWRPLIDTTVAAQMLYGAPQEWSTERRGTDFYDEGWLIWLDADTLIRQLTTGQHSLDDFCRRFAGAPSGPAAVKPYTFEDVVTTLNEIAAYDWRTFFHQRLYTTGPHAPLAGIDRGGWQLIYNTEQGPQIKDLETARKQVEMGYSLGLELNTDGLITDVIPEMPAAQAKLGPGMTVTAVNGKKFSPDTLRDAVAAAKTSQEPIQLLVNNEDTLLNYLANYHGGEQYPHLLHNNTKPDLLSKTITPLTQK